jgi:hypothetical protein
MKADLVTLGAGQKAFGTRVVIRRWLIVAALAIVTLSSIRLVDAQGLLYTVTSTGDGGLVGTEFVCDDGTGHCTLRAAIEASNIHTDTDGIDFAIPITDPGYDPDTGAWTINLTKALPDISDPVDITGPGADVLIVRRDTGGFYRIFNVTATTGTLTFSGITISNGEVVLDEDNGGGIAITNGGATVSIIGCTISGNSAAFGNNGGGGIYIGGGTTNLTNTTVIGNSALGDTPGGGILNEGMLTVTNSTISGNSAAGGGGIFNVGTLLVDNSTIGGNSAPQGSEGGILNDGLLNASNSTISGNSGYGIFNSGAANQATIKSSIIALNTNSVTPDVGGSFTSQGFNLIGKVDGSTGFTQPTDQTGTVAAPLDPKLDPTGLQDNGGPTQTIALLFGSPAIDRGTSDGLFGTLITDQRGTGFARTFDDPAIPNAAGGDGADVGAFEVQTAAPTPTPSPSPSPSPTPIPTTFGNISTRARVETGDNVLIGGFIITGSQAKKVMVRAIGPSLPLAGVLADPILELHGGTGALLASSDNWMDAPNKQEIIDSTIQPTNDLESAILMSLDPGLYTAIVRGVNDTTGIALVEAYDLDLGVDSILANISTRGLVQTGDDVMIGGIIILGTDAQEVLLRAIGPSLPLTGALVDPTLELHDKDGVIIATNDDWRSDQEADIMATGIPPTDDAESAILMTLTPDAYTAIVRGKDDTTGVALVEAYQLDK